MTERIDPPVVPIEIDGQLNLFSGDLTDEQVRAIFSNVRLRGDRDTLFAEPTDQVIPWP
jgi:hypothetical protein